MDACVLCMNGPCSFSCKVSKLFKLSESKTLVKPHHITSQQQQQQKKSNTGIRKTMKTVAVIGLGPSGLVATKELKAKGFTVTAFDSLQDIGGIWSAPPGEGKFGIYKELCWNASRSFSEYSDFPWNKEDYKDLVGDLPDQGGCFATAQEFKLYLDAYATHFDLSASFRLQTRVKSIQRYDEKDEKGGYKLTICSTNNKEAGEEEEILEFDAVVICTGKDGEANNPLQDTVFKHFTGEILHSQDFKSVTDYDGKRVLLVGAVVSGSDLSARLAEHGKCQSVVNAVRTVPYHVNKFSKKDKTAVDEHLLSRAVSWMSPYLPYGMAFEGLKQATLQHNPEQLTEEMTGSPDLVPDKDLRKAYIGFTLDYVEYVKDKKITAKPVPVSAEGNEVSFKDGTTQSFDTVILCTGYKGWDLSILPTDIRKEVEHKGPTGQVEPALFHRCLVPGIPDLAFIGLPNIGAITPCSEMLARYIASVFNEDIPRPNEKKIKAEADAFRKHRDAGRFNRYDVTTDIQEMVGAELGVTPTVLQAMRNPSELLFGSMYPSYYRTNAKIDGEEVAKKAKERYEWCKKNPMIYQDVKPVASKTASDNVNPAMNKYTNP